MLMVVSRVSGVQAAGEFGISYAIAQLLYIVGLFGVNHYQMTDYGKKTGFGNYALVKVITSLFMLLLCGVIILAFSYSFIRAMQLFLLTVYMMVNSLAELYQSLFFQENKLGLVGRSLFFRSLISFAVFATVLYTTNGIITALIAVNFVNIVTLGLFTILPSRGFLNKSDFGFSRSSCRLLLKECLPLCVSLFMMAIMVNSAKYVIDFMGDGIMQGYFNIVFVPVQVIHLFSSFVFKPQLIRYSGYVEKLDNSSFYKLFFKQIAIIAGLTVTGAVLGGFLGPAVLGFVFSADLTAYRFAIVLIIIGGGAFAVSVLLYYLLIIFREQKKILFCYFCCSIISLLLGYIMISSFEIAGAAMSFILSYVLLTVLFVVVMLRSFKARRAEDMTEDRV